MAAEACSKKLIGKIGMQEQNLLYFVVRRRLPLYERIYCWLLIILGVAGGACATINACRSSMLIFRLFYAKKPAFARVNDPEELYMYYLSYTLKTYVFFFFRDIFATSFSVPCYMLSSGDNITLAIGGH